MKTCILYHANCYDGFGAAFAAWLHFRDDAEYFPVNYGQPMPEMDKGSDVFILDFSYPEDVLLNLMTAHEVVVLDHHKTAEKDLSNLASKFPESIRFDMSKSGAVMAWEYFIPSQPVPEFFLYLQDRDLWTFALPKSREVSCALRSYPMNFEKWSELTGLVTQGQIYELPGILIDQLKKEGEAALRLTNMQVDWMAKNHRFFEFRDCCDSSWSLKPTHLMPHNTELGFVVPVANASVFFSEVGERLLEMYPSASFSAYYFDRADGKRQWGMRSRPDFDCSKIAKLFGGGGHKQASGFTENI